MKDAIHYYSEVVKPGYSQMYRDIVVGGELIECGKQIGSPAPTETVKRYERVIF